MHAIFLIPGGVLGTCLLLFFLQIFWFGDVPKKVRKKIIKVNAGFATGCALWLVCFVTLAHYNIVDFALPWDKQPMVENLPKRDDGTLVVPTPVDTTGVEKPSPLKAEKEANKEVIKELDESLK